MRSLMRPLNTFITEKLQITRNKTTRCLISITPLLFKFAECQFGGVEYMGKLVGIYEVYESAMGTYCCILYLPSDIHEEYLDETYIPENPTIKQGQMPRIEVYNVIKNEHKHILRDNCYIEGLDFFIKNNYIGTKETPYGAKRNKNEFMDFVKFCKYTIEQTNDVSSKDISLNPDDYEWD